MPAEHEAAKVHGEYRPGNLLVHPAGPHIMALVDSESLTQDHPLADLGYMCVTYQPHPPAAGCTGSDFAALGIPTQDELITA